MNLQYLKSNTVTSRITYKPTEKEIKEMYNEEGDSLDSNEEGNSGVELNDAGLNNIMGRTILKIQHEMDKQQEEKEAKEAKHTASIPKPQTTRSLQ